MTTVLVVDDDERMAHTVAHWVGKSVDVVVALSYERALHLLETRRDVRGVFADVRLGPEHPEGGLALLEAAYAKDPRCVLTACSGSDTAAVRARAARVGAVFVPTLLDLAALRAMVEKVKREERVRPYSSPPPASGATTVLRHREALRVAAALGLTDTEAAVLAALAVFRGKKHGELAEGLAMSTDTFNTHARHIARKAAQPLAAVLASLDDAVLTRATQGGGGNTKE